MIKLKPFNFQAYPYLQQYMPHLYFKTSGLVMFKGKKPVLDSYASQIMHASNLWYIMLRLTVSIFATVP
jgi:hypothetical protein